ncbi:hypothetical protein [Wansuia hejianensis]|uniref:Uncharacterized protein n=1 Tax=Wansuia hejianensis TaxID=2763667 RepID=A0A926IMG5_9FIRM|nr:hypothetical protein [Wansuia hejianensis]MBC8590596.1 hypothetical protein [Wansuia hejianensis]
MESTKIKLFKAVKILITVAIILVLFSTINYTYLHIFMYPVPVIFQNEIIMFIFSLIVLFFTNRYKFKYLKVLSIINAILGIINILGFNFTINIFNK